MTVELQFENSARCKGIGAIAPPLALNEHLEPVSTKSKNWVYKAETSAGPAIVKFIRKQSEAQKEGWALGTLSQTPELSTHIPQSLLPQPVPVLLNGASRHLVIMQDISAFVNPQWESRRHSPEHATRMQYISDVLALLAKIHTLGTVKYAENEQQLNARRYFREELYGRIARVAGPAEVAFLEQKGFGSVENGTTFIHQDPKHHNRVGQYLVDWGSSGLGNYLMDIARLCEETVVKNDLSPNLSGIRQILNKYWKFRCDNKPDEERELVEYCKAAYLQNLVQIDYLTEKAERRDSLEDATLMSMREGLPQLRENALNCKF